ncbi:MAG: queuosine salvage family protein [Anaerolineae bacterium]
MSSPSRRIPRQAFQAILAEHPDPLGVLATTAPVVAHAQYVSIDLRRIDTVAHVLSLHNVPIPAWNYDYHYYDGGERSVLYIFLLDALNFSFWGEPRWKISYRGKTLDGYWALAAALKRAALSHPKLLDADFLADLSPKELARILRGEGEIPMLMERWRNAQELGRVLREHFGGRASNVVKAADFDAPRLARLVAENFSCFHDTSIYDSREVRFFKRAQILAADLWGSFGGVKWGKLSNLNGLTCFADYKLPQILRDWGVMHYDARLAMSVDNRAPLPKDSPEENEIRAAMLWSVEFLRQRLNRYGREINSVQVDWYLWENSQHLGPDARPYHRVRTIYY